MNIQLQDKILAKYGTFANFGRVINVSKSTISEWKSGKYMPSLKTMEKIARLTYGYIMPNDWIGA